MEIVIGISCFIIGYIVRLIISRPKSSYKKIMSYNGIDFYMLKETYNNNYFYIANIKNMIISAMSTYQKENNIVSTKALVLVTWSNSKYNVNVVDFKEPDV